ncbi:IS21 family transposase [Fulvivirga sp. M361]|uniref:IS21 family transposase n=1 Tax=Fulvivirga sp. M361 TaxID=2594266 RepID=UPI00117B94BC|nr:IS21 family transposase [Fulvivirga sp. M361]TRX45305.1 IS21 family transposase [Fulvivirga sp. M361]
MNVYLAKFMMYYEIHRLHHLEGRSVSWISQHLVLNRRTVNKYLAMSEQDYEQFLIKQSSRSKKLDIYEGFIRDRLELYRDTSAAQMHDWLKEHFPDFPAVNQKTVFNFVHYVRDKYQLPVVKTERQFQAIEELPYGQQAQVDFGHSNMRTSTGKRVKVSFFTLVLSRSRFKYVWFTDQPFTSELAIKAHQRAFEHINGIPDEVVYDQDKVFMISENNGDIILTSGFKAYMQTQSFKLHFCRKADPQSKGKVENVVKYVKSNFLYNRTYYNADTLNDEAMGWLGRTANMLPHAGTQKIPYDEWMQEQPFLKPLQPYSGQTASISVYTVRKDNTISYKGNFYSLPLGTYQGKGTKVAIHIDQGLLIISEANADKQLARHKLATGSGQRIINNNHKRDNSTAIEEMINQVADLMPDAEKALKWLQAIRKKKSRYIRDQLIAISQTVKQTNDELIVGQALEYCLQNSIYSASDFTAIIDHSIREGQQKEAKIITLNPLNGQNKADAWQKPQTSSIEEYQQVIETNKKNG